MYLWFYIKLHLHFWYNRADPINIFIKMLKFDNDIVSAAICRLSVNKKILTSETEIEIYIGIWIKGDNSHQ